MACWLSVCTLGRGEISLIYSIYLSVVSHKIQSLEFIAETRILSEMKIENNGKKYFLWGEKSTTILFFCLFLLRTARRCQQIEDTKLIFIMNFSVPDFFKFASRMPQFAQIFSLNFQKFPGVGERRRGGGGGGAYPWTYLEISFFFFISNSRLWKLSEQICPLVHMACWLSVCTLGRGEIGLIYSIYLSVVSHKTVWADLSFGIYGMLTQCLYWVR